MAWYSCAEKRKIDWLNNLSRGGVRPRFLVFHLSASEAVSQHGYFSGVRTAGSHLHVARNGHREQYAGTGARSAAERGVRDTISVETQGADAGGLWTPEQCESLATIAAEAHRVDGIPLRLATRSDDPAGGIAWHRLGVDGSFPALPSPLAGRTQRGGVLWSGSRGKVCPGDRRIEQIPGILARTIELVAGPTPAPAPAPVPDVQEDEVILIRNTADGRVYLVSGGRATYLADSADQGALLRAGVKQVDVTSALASTIAKWT